MKRIIFLLPLLLTIAMVYVLDRPFANKQPAMGKFLSPITGFWQQEGARKFSGDKLLLDGLSQEVTVHFDERSVPHIFADNMNDAAYAQGYVTARDRLWQMEFQTIAAAGRLAEFMGPDFTAGDGAILNRDRLFRRLGLGYAADQALAAVKKDPEMFAIIEAYAAGVNAYISELDFNDLPIEYKLLNYQPEEWTPLKTCYLFKYMGNVLSSVEHDLDHTRIWRAMGAETFNHLFPDGNDNTSPVIPSGVAYDFATVQLDTPELVIEELLSPQHEIKEPPVEPGLGSNNWAISGEMSNTGNPILCNDPHLMLNLPSLWYEVQLHTKDMNVYGVSLPGAPGVVIGFNEKVAWGVTNAGRDVRDWYRIHFEGDEMDRYRFEGNWRETSTRLEVIKVKGGADLYDTVYYTHHGPVVYDERFPKTDQFGYALRWELHQPSNEMRTFFNLNKAENYADYREAIKFYQCPGQNFVFASLEGDIGITQQGRFPARWPQQGRYLMDGSKAANDWQEYIPFAQNATVKNPERGFVSSANQFPADSTYPYYQSGNFASNRCRRINERLTEMSQSGKVGVEEMKALQQDNFNYAAADGLPAMLEAVEEMKLSTEAQAVVKQLSNWDYMHHADSKEASYFKEWFKQLLNLTWDEFDAMELDRLKRPSWYRSTELMRNQPNDKFFDIVNTEAVETLSEVAVEALEMAAAEELADWSTYKSTGAFHVLKSLEAFSRPNLRTSGDRRIVNATGKDFGPSWRMVVALGEWPTAYGVYPGGQSGNPGQEDYDNFIDTWAQGDYFELEFLRDKTDLPAVTLQTISLQPK